MLPKTWALYFGCSPPRALACAQGGRAQATTVADAVFGQRGLGVCHCSGVRAGGRSGPEGLGDTPTLACLDGAGGRSGAEGLGDTPTLACLDAVDTHRA
eukprot:2409992-Alexandrium_andersonii.AAC.1